MIMKLFFKPFSFTDEKSRYFTNILCGETGSGKSSLIMQLLFSLLTNKNAKMPFKKVFLNIDGFDFDYFNSLAKSNGRDVQFLWLDMHDLFCFAKEERELYQQYSTDGEGTIAKRIRENIDEEYRKYFSSLIVCDEADNYIGTDISKEVKTMAQGFSNFMKFKRHHHIELWFLTQKFQNLHNSFYNNGAINRFLRVRSMFFSFGSTKVIQHWLSSDTSKKDNLLDQYWYEVNPELYNRYDVGANITASDGNVKKFKLLLAFFFIGITFSIYLGYQIIGTYFETPTSSPQQISITKTVNNQKVQEVKTIDNVVKCITFKDTSNCYYDDQFSSIPNDFIMGLMEQNISKISVLFVSDDISFISVDDTGLSFIFSNNQLQRGKNEKDD